MSPIGANRSGQRNDPAEIASTSQIRGFLNGRRDMFDDAKLQEPSVEKREKVRISIAKRTLSSRVEESLKVYVKW
jgi:hypothetical protein